MRKNWEGVLRCAMWALWLAKAGNDIVQFLRNVYSSFSRYVRFCSFQVALPSLGAGCHGHCVRCFWDAGDPLQNHRSCGDVPHLLRWALVAKVYEAIEGQSFRMNFMKQWFLGRKGLGIQVSDLLFSWELPKQKSKMHCTLSDLSDLLLRHLFAHGSATDLVEG